MALEIARKTGALYLDLEHPADLAKLSDPADYSMLPNSPAASLFPAKPWRHTSTFLWTFSCSDGWNHGTLTPPSAS